MMQVLSRLFTGLTILAAAAAAVAQPANPLPGPTLSAQAAPVGPQDPVPGPGDGAPDARPTHPSPELIPPMPMPEPGPWQPPIRGSVTVFDIVSGQSRELPVIEPSGLPGGFTEGYVGADANVEMPEMARNFGTMAPATNLNAYPASANCKVIMRFQNVNGVDYWFGCSGTMLDSGIVLTAAHCVYAREPNGITIFDWAREIYVYPGWDGMGPAGGYLEDTVIQNWGWVRASELIAGTDYVEDGNFDQDVGAIRISREWGRSVGMLTGWYGGAWGQSCSTIQSRTYYNYSFPGEDCGSPGLHDGRTMMFWSGTFDSCPSNQLQLDTTPGCFTAVWGGMSGSSAYYLSNGTRIAHAVASNSNRSTAGRYCKIWEDMANQISALSSSNRGTTFDLTTLRYRLTGSTTIQATTQTSTAQFAAPNPTNANPAAGSYTFRVYLSTNNRTFDSDTLLGTFVYSADYGAMQNLTVNVPPVTIPNVAPGTYWLGVILDPNTDAFDDNNSTDLWDCQQITVTAAPPPAPGNNTCAGAYSHAIGTSSPGTTVYATNEGDTTCGFATANDVWYRVIPPVSGIVQFDTCGSFFDTVLSLHTACPGTPGNQVACNDDAGANGDCPGTTQSVITPIVTGGATYYLRVAGYNGASGNFTLNSRYVPPANDDCSGAIAHFVGTTSNGSLAGGSNDGQAACGASGSAADVWFTVTPAQTGFLRLDTCGSTFDTVLSVHTSCPGTTSNQIGCNDDSGTVGPCPGTLQSVLDVGVVGGQTYYIRVSGFSGAVGNFSLHSAFIAPPNDDCSGVITLAAGTSTTGITTGATPGGSATCGSSNSAPDVWYRMVASCTGTLRLDTCGSTYDTVLSVHTACPGIGGNQLACNDDAGPIGPCPGSLQSLIDLNVYANTTYYIRVSGYNGNTGFYRLNSAYLITSGADSCEDAPTIGDGTYVYSNCGATTDGPAETPCFGGGDTLISRDLWFDYVAPSTGTVTVDTCASAAPTHNTRVAVYAGGCPGGTPDTALACNDDSCGQLSSLTFSAAAGQHYLVRVGGMGTSRGTGTLTIATAAPCDPDVNCDGSVNGFDIEATEQAINGDYSNFCQASADLNGDGAENGFDIETEEQRVNGSPC